jgi:hypothetical protein
MSRYIVTIQLDESNGTERAWPTLTGTVRVEAHAEVKCRKLVLYCQRRQLGQESKDKKKALQATVAKWETWMPGESYSYPFEFETDVRRVTQGEPLGATGDWFFLPEVHLVGEFQPDTTAGWIKTTDASSNAAIENKTDTRPDNLSSEQQTLDEKKHSSDLEGFDSSGAASALSKGSQEAIMDGGHGKEASAASFFVGISFDLKDRSYRVGNQISGKIHVRPDQCYEMKRLRLCYQWRMHGRAELMKGEIIEISLAESESWLPEQNYEYAFTFTIEDGPVTARGHNQNLDWYAWAEMDLVPEPNVVFSTLESEFIVLPARDLLNVRQSEEWLMRPLIAHIAWPIGLILVPIILYGWFYATVELDLPFFLSTLLEEEEFNTGQQILSFIPCAITLAVGYATFYTARTSHRSASYQFAEMRLGLVEVDFSGMPGKRAIRCQIRFHPSRKVFVKAVTLRLKVQEITSYQEGTRTVTKKRWLNKTQEIRELKKYLEANEPFEDHISLLVPKGLPMSRTGVSHSILWRLEVRILVKRWFNWRREYPVNVSI